MIRTFHREEAEKIACERRVFKVVGGQKLDMIVCYPKTAAPAGCILFIHGGGWTSDSCGRLKLHAQYAAQNGAVGISASYRLLDGQTCTDVRDGLADCVDALAYARALCEKKYAGLKMTAVGDSAGGYYAACLGCGNLIKEVSAQQVRPADYVVDLNGIIDLTGKWGYGIRLKKEDLCSAEELRRKFSPIWRIAEGDAPVLIVHGTRDKTVSPSDARRYAQALEAHGVRSHLKMLRGAAHAFILFDYHHDNAYVAKILHDILKFLSDKKMI